MSDVRVGLLLAQYGSAVQQTLAAARTADDEGIDVWVAGHLLALSRQRAASTFEPLSLMGAIAAVTRRARLGCMVYSAPNLPPFALAKTMITLDHLSGGRLEVGLGAGWMEAEFRALGGPMPSGAERRAHLEHTIDAVIALSEGVEWDSGGGHLVSSQPTAVQQPHPPLWIAGQGPRTLDLVGRRADWANFARGISIGAFEEAAARIRHGSVAAGRDEHAVKLSLTNTFLGGVDEAEARRALEARALERGGDAGSYRKQLRAANALAGSPSEIALQLRPYLDAGCEAFILWSLDHHDLGVAAVLARVQDNLRGFQDGPTARGP